MFASVWYWSWVPKKYLGRTIATNENPVMRALRTSHKNTCRYQTPPSNYNCGGLLLELCYYCCTCCLPNTARAIPKPTYILGKKLQSPAQATCVSTTTTVCHHHQNEHVASTGRTCLKPKPSQLRTCLLLWPFGQRPRTSLPIGADLGPLAPSGQGCRFQFGKEGGFVGMNVHAACTSKLSWNELVSFTEGAVVVLKYLKNQFPSTLHWGTAPSCASKSLFKGVTPTPPNYYRNRRISTRNKIVTA